MTHPLIAQILEIATPLAADLGFEVVSAAWQTQKHPPVLRLDIRNLAEDTSLNDCEKMSRALEEALDSQEIIPSAYVLEISSPGISRQLTTEREFLAFKGFAVVVATAPPYNGQKEWRGRLQKRDELAIHITQKGRPLAIPWEQVSQVYLDESRSDRG